MNIPSIKIRAGLWLLLLTGLILAGCAPKQRAVDDSFAFGNDYENLTGPDRSTMTPEERFAYDYRSAAVARMRDEGVPLSNVHLVERAKTAIGTPYVRGGTSMSGFDCSGFVQWAYKSVGVSLPRTAREQSVLGTPIDSDEMGSRRYRGFQASPAWVSYGYIRWRRQVHPQPPARQERGDHLAQRSLFQFDVPRRPPCEHFGIRCRSRAETDGAV